MDISLAELGRKLQEMGHNLETDQIGGLYNVINTTFNEINTKADELRGLFSTMAFEISQLKIQNQCLNDEKTELSTEVDSLKNEIIAINEDRDNIRTELREVRNENDFLLNELKKRDSLKQNMIAFAKTVLQSNNGVNGIVNSLPAFSEQMVLTDRPNSLTNFGSVAEMEGMRLQTTQSKEKTYLSTQITLQTSDEDYYDAVGSQRWSLTNGGTVIPPKVQQNQVSSTVNSERLPTPLCATEIHNQSMISGNTESTNFYFDANNNLKLKFVKVPINQLLNIFVSFVSSPSDFWVQISPQEVNDYLHLIQVKQTEFRQLKNSSLSAADIELGMYCAAIFSLDGYWYRAQVINITYENPIEMDSIKAVLVLYIDWGNTEERPLSKIMKLSPDLTKRRQAVNCYIQGYCPLTDWTEKSRLDFEKVTREKILSATFCKPDSIDGTPDNIVYPIDLVFQNEDEVFVNIRSLLSVNEPNAEPISTKTTVASGLQSSSHSNEKSNDTIVCNARLNGHSNPNISGDKSVSNMRPNGSKKVRLIDEKSKSNQNCATNSVPEPPNRVPKSLPLLDCFSEPKSDSFRIPPPIIPDTSGGLIVETSHPLHPLHLYFHIRDTQVGNAQFEDLEDQLNAFYSKHSPPYVTQPSEVSVGSFWVTCFSNDKRWYRCRVVHKELDRVLVNYVDWGNEEWTVPQNLMHLTRQFAVYPAMAVKSRLAYVSPKGSDEWSEESLEFFADLIYEKPLTAFIIQKPTDFGFDSFLDVFLWITGDNDEEVLINWLLVKEGFAETESNDWINEIERGLREKTPPQLISEFIPNLNNSIQLTATTSSAANTPAKVVTTNVNGGQPSPVSNHIPAAVNGWDFDPSPLEQSISALKFKILPELPENESTEDDEWDPMADDAASLNNNYNVRPNDAGIATVGFRPKDQKICKYYGSPKGCRMNDMCPFVHVDPDKRFEINDTEEVLYDCNEMKLSVGSLYFFKVSSIVNPDKFYGYLPFGTTDFNTLLQSEDFIENKAINEISVCLKNHYSNPNRIKENFNIFPIIGSLVAYKDITTGEYFRGRVIAVDIERSVCKILNIDFGFEVDVKRRSVFNLEKYFAHQHPAQAILCSLTQIRPFNSDSWSQQAVDAFSECVSGKLLCIHIIYGQTDGKYYVDLIDREDDKEVQISKFLVDLKFAKSDASPDSALTTCLSDDEIYKSDDSDLD